MKNTLLSLCFKIAIIAFTLLGLTLTSCNNVGNHNSKSNKADTLVNISSGSIVYFNLDKVIAGYDMANELKATVSSKINGIQQEITRRGNKLQTEFNSFNDKINKGLITRSTAEVQGQELQKKQNEFNAYAAKKQQEINEEQQVMLNQIGDSIKKFLDKYNEEKKYSLIISTQGDILPSPVVTGDSSLDITNDIIEKLNDEYVKNKAKGIVPSLDTKSDNK